jgi:hypothetical protein
VSHGSPDGNLWFTEHDANKIGRITITDNVSLVLADYKP